MNAFSPTASIQTLYSVEDTAEALAALQNRQLVIVNLEHLAAESAQRVTDTLAGAACAIGGRVMHLGDDAYLFAPDFFQVSIQNEPKVA